MFWTWNQLFLAIMFILGLPLFILLLTSGHLDFGLVLGVVAVLGFGGFVGLGLLFNRLVSQRARRALQSLQQGDWQVVRKSEHPVYPLLDIYTHGALRFDGFVVQVTECAYREIPRHDRPISQAPIFEHWLLTMVEPNEGPDWVQKPTQRRAPRSEIRQQIVEALWPQPSGWAPSHGHFQVVPMGVVEHGHQLDQEGYTEEVGWAQALRLLAAVAAMSLKETRLIAWLCAERQSDGQRRARAHRIALATVAFRYFADDARLAPYAQWAMEQEGTALSAYAILKYGTREQCWAAAQRHLEDRALRVQLMRRAVQELRAAGQIQTLCEHSALLKPRTDLSEVWLEVCLTSPQPAHIPLLWALFEVLSLDEGAGTRILEALEALGEAAWVHPRCLMSANAALRRRSQQAIFDEQGPEAFCEVAAQILEEAREEPARVLSEERLQELIDLLGQWAHSTQLLRIRPLFEGLAGRSTSEDLQLRIEAALLRIEGRTGALGGGLSAVAEGAEGALSVAARGGRAERGRRVGARPAQGARAVRHSGVLDRQRARAVRHSGVLDRQRARAVRQRCAGHPPEVCGRPGRDAR